MDKENLVKLQIHWTMMNIWQAMHYWCVFSCAVQNMETENHRFLRLFSYRLRKLHAHARTRTHAQNSFSWRLDSHCLILDSSSWLVAALRMKLHYLNRNPDNDLKQWDRQLGLEHSGAGPAFQSFEPWMVQVHWAKWSGMAKIAPTFKHCAPTTITISQRFHHRSGCLGSLFSTRTKKKK